MSFGETSGGILSCVQEGPLATAPQTRAGCRSVLRSISAIAAIMGRNPGQMRQRAHSGQVVRGHGQREQFVDLVEPAQHHVADRADHRAPAKTLLDGLSPALTDRAPLASRRCPLCIPEERFLRE